MKIAIVNADVANVAADLLVLKYADNYYGADKKIAAMLEFDEHIPNGGDRLVSGGRLSIAEVLFLGVGPLNWFRYEQIQDFGSRAIRLAAKSSRPVKKLALTVHGPGYGLDIEESFLSMIAGIINELKSVPNYLDEIIICEISSRRCELLRSVMKERGEVLGAKWDSNTEVFTILNGAGAETSTFGARAESTARLFVAMPFSEDFQDVFEFGFHEAAKRNSFICERLDLVNFTGDIVAEIKKRILSSNGVIALLDTFNPNVFLEIGFAWAHGKPTILVAKDNGLPLPFDVRGHRCIFYRNLTNLRDVLTREIAALKSGGVLAGN